MKITIIIFVHLLLLCTNSIFAQIRTEEYPQRPIEPDSLFITFEYPKLPSYIKRGNIGFEYKNKNLAIAEIQIAVYFYVNSEGYIREIIVNPLFNIGNNISKHDYFWKDIEKSIRKSASKWKVKTLYFPDGDTLKSPYVNTAPSFRPYGGNQFHFMILNYIGDIHIHGLASFIYWMAPPIKYVEK